MLIDFLDTENPSIEENSFSKDKDDAVERRCYTHAVPCCAYFEHLYEAKCGISKHSVCKHYGSSKTQYCLVWGGVWLIVGGGEQFQVVRMVLARLRNFRFYMLGVGGSVVWLGIGRLGVWLGVGHLCFWQKNGCLSAWREIRCLGTKREIGCLRTWRGIGWRGIGGLRTWRGIGRLGTWREIGTTRGIGCLGTWRGIRCLGNWLRAGEEAGDG
eukprot:4458436-Pleurochrysis_carterae.AAC.7